MEITKKEIEEILTEHTDRYIGALKEDFDHKIDAVLEYVKDIPQMKEDIAVLKEDVSGLKEDVSVLKNDVGAMKPMLNATFEKVGEIAEAVTVIKETVKDHERRLQRLEAR